MKTKVLSFMMAIAVALAFTSCDNKGTSSASGDSDSTSSSAASESVSSSSASDEQSEASESVSEETQEEDAAVSSEPTGDAAADARQMAEDAINLMNSVDISNIKTPEDAENWNKEFTKKADELQKKYEDFYKAKGDDALKQFKEECDKLQKDPEFSKKMEEAENAMMEKVMKVMK